MVVVVVVVLVVVEEVGCLLPISALVLLDLVEKVARPVHPLVARLVEVQEYLSAWVLLFFLFHLCRVVDVLAEERACLLLL